MIFFFGSRRTSIFGGTGGVMRPAPRDRGASGWEHPVSLIGHCPIFGEFGHLAQKSQLFGRRHGRHYRRHCHLVTV